MSKGNKLGGLAGVASSFSDTAQGRRSGRLPWGTGWAQRRTRGWAWPWPCPQGLPARRERRARRQTGMLGSLRTVTAGRAGQGEGGGAAQKRNLDAEPGEERRSRTAAQRDREHGVRACAEDSRAP